ncbi:FG-GAP repeat protein [Nitrosomonas sp. Nm84]|uniref:beta strand repeat-containing protein n=1 Tax=Nitrosomonas sp. Nm84 TaxID=200124 RepID=UPI000D811A20|nr:integrin alpha [Nitrosomonas sp. Nm84]PXW88258.1 FG-GAP repeat protein [Nitrosomonas sp. Nm84]
MALTDQQQISILQLTQAMFNATPGAIYLQAFGGQMIAEKSLSELAQSLSGSDLFFGRNYSADLTPGRFAVAFVNDLVGNRASFDNIVQAAGYISNKMAAGTTQAELIAELTQALSAIPASDPDWGEASVHYNASIVTKVVDHLLGDSVTAADKAFAVDYMLAQMAAGQTFGSVVEWAITALDNANRADPTWGDAAALFDNRIEVSQYYSVDKAGSATDLAILQNILSGVTADVTSVATAKAAIDSSIIDLSFDLASLDGSNGFRLDGAAANDFSGGSISSAGDVNDDGFDDLIVGAHGTDPNGSYSGSSYVVFGKATGFNAALDLSSLNGSSGFRLDGVATDDGAGRSVSTAGDVNNDGFDDVIVGAPNPGWNGKTGYLSNSYVVFGKASGFHATLDLSDLDGNNGFQLKGVALGDLLGTSVSNAGDVNGDGFDDVIVSARRAGPNGYGSGASYVVFGKASGFNDTLDLSNLDGSNGFRLDGVVTGDASGESVSTAGDVNGDGFADLIVGAPGADLNGDKSGASYVVFGKATGFNAALNLSDLNGSNGFRLDGVAENDRSGSSVSSAGDVNGDGFDDVIVGAFNANPNSDRSGASYVVFGKATGFDATLNLSSLNGSNGFRLDGGITEYSGNSVSGAGDVNGDGFDDLIIGASGSSSPNGNYSGASYIVFGKSAGFNATLNLTRLSSDEGFRLDGVATGDESGSQVSNAGDVNGDGFDDLMIGAARADPNGDFSGSSYVVFGSSSLGGGNVIEGTSGDDNLTGTSATEIFEAGAGNDIMTGGGGADVFYGGAGADTIHIADLNFQRVGGGTDIDELALGNSNLGVNLVNIGGKISGIEMIRLAGDGINSLTLTAADLPSLSNTTDTLTVIGNTGDHVTVQGSGWTDGDSRNGFHAYIHDDAVLLVGMQVTVDFI